MCDVAGCFGFDAEMLAGFVVGLRVLWVSRLLILVFCRLGVCCLI